MHQPIHTVDKLPDDVASVKITQGTLFYLKTDHTVYYYTGTTYLRLDDIATAAPIPVHVKQTVW